MKITYVGPEREVECALPDGTWPTVKHGETIDVPDGWGTEALKQPANWAPAEKKSPKTD